MSNSMSERLEASAQPFLPRIAVLGYGAIGQQVVQAIQTRIAPQAPLCVVRRQVLPVHATGEQPLHVCTDLPALLAWQPDVVVECAGHGAVADYVAPLLAQGVDVIMASVGVLADAPLQASLQQAAHDSGALLQTVSGAIGALDALSAAAPAGLNWVRYTGRKPPLAWKSTPAEQQLDLAQLVQAETIFTGSAREAALAYPKNANVAAAVALAGIGFDLTEVRLVADPSVDTNVHELHAQGAFGELQFSIANSPLPQNPKSSWLAALSVSHALSHYVGLNRRRTTALPTQPRC